LTLDSNLDKVLQHLWQAAVTDESHKHITTILDFAHGLAKHASQHGLVPAADAKRLFQQTPLDDDDQMEEEGQIPLPPPSYNLTALSPFRPVESTMSLNDDTVA
jgi:hypothetical protein